VIGWGCWFPSVIKVEGLHVYGVVVSDLAEICARSGF
jgi:hypothetical protein